MGAVWDEPKNIYLSNFIDFLPGAMLEGKAEFFHTVFLLLFSNSTILLRTSDESVCTSRTQRLSPRSWIRARAVPGKQRKIASFEQRDSLTRSVTHAQQLERTDSPWTHVLPNILFCQMIIYYLWPNRTQVLTWRSLRPILSDPVWSNCFWFSVSQQCWVLLFVNA